MSGDRRVFIVKRFRPEQESAPTTERYEIPVRPDWAILDVLNYIKDEVDPTLSHRWSCRMGVCGSCGVMVNGRPKLACSTFVRDYPGEIRVDPLTNFPVIRDLVIEMDGFLQRMKEVKPWIIRAKERAIAEGEYRQTPAELQEFKQFSMCINCMLCYAACPVSGLEPHFLGPAAIAIGHRYNLDSRDEGRNERLDLFREDGGVYTCSFVNECTEVCPTGVDPGYAIQQEKLLSALDWARSLVLPRGGR
jgi:fumarate reductase iron-sulfur subunit